MAVETLFYVWEEKEIYIQRYIEKNQICKICHKLKTYEKYVVFSIDRIWLDQVS